MHMADALLSPAVGAAGYGISGGLLAWAARRVARDRDYERQVPLMGVLGAFIFAAQMINFSIPGTGSSGHIGGGLLLSILLGPWPAFLVIASVLTVQCFFFLDGGLLALGCNVFNLGFWPAFAGLPLYRLLRGQSPSTFRETLAAVIATVAALELGAFGVVAETVLSGRSELPLGGFLALMLGIHFPIALGEGLLTGIVVTWARRHFADRVTPLAAPPAAAGFKPLLVGFGLLTLLTAGVLAWFASAHPDGLEWSLQKLTGSAEVDTAQSPIVNRLQAVQEKTAFLPDYNLPAAESTANPAEDNAEPAGTWPAVKGGTTLAGITGAAITALLIGTLGWTLHRFQGRLEKG